MTLKRAIEIVTKLERTLAPTMAADGTDAIRLLIEAGKRCLVIKQESVLKPFSLLPGETED